MWLKACLADMQSDFIVLTLIEVEKSQGFFFSKGIVTYTPSVFQAIDKYPGNVTILMTASSFNSRYNRILRYAMKVYNQDSWVNLNYAHVYVNVQAVKFESNVIQNFRDLPKWLSPFNFYTLRSRDIKKL